MNLCQYFELIQPYAADSEPGSHRLRHSNLLTFATSPAGEVSEPRVRRGGGKEMEFNLGRVILETHPVSYPEILSLSVYKIPQRPRIEFAIFLF